MARPRPGCAKSWTGDYHTWAAVWATDSLQQVVAVKAYTVNLASGIKPVDSHTHEASVIATITSPTKANYTTTARATATGGQLTKAAVRLADLLNAIAWK